MKNRIIACLLAVLLFTPFTVSRAFAASDAGFTDTDGHWALEAVSYVVREGLMNGVEDGSRFAPDMNLTRGMVVTVLYRSNASPDMTYKDAFGDVKEGAYYTSAAIWASECGIVNGTGDVNGVAMFSPDRDISRAELAAMFMRYAEYIDADMSATVDLSVFPDASRVASWAQKSVKWAVTHGLITGKKNGRAVTLSPEDKASRAEFATVMRRFKLDVTPIVLQGVASDADYRFALFFNKGCGIRALSVTVSYDPEKFSFLSADFSRDGALEDISAETGNAVIAFDSLTDMELSEFSFILKPMAQTAPYEPVSVKVVINDGAGNSEPAEYKATYIVDYIYHTEEGSN